MIPMPIGLLLDAVVARHRPAARLQLRDIGEAFRRLGRALRARVEPLEAAVLRTRRAPVVGWRGHAVTAAIVRAQHGALGTRAQPVTLRSVGLDPVRDAVVQETLLWDLFDTMNAALGGVEASMDRFREPPAAMFDPRSVRAGDLFGQLALGFRATRENLPDLRRARDAVGRAQHRRNVRGWADNHPPLALALPERLDTLTRWVAGAMLILPALPRLLDGWFAVGGMAARVKLLDLFAGIEGSVQAMSRQILGDVKLALAGAALEGTSLLFVVEEVVTGGLRFYVAFGVAFGDELLVGLRAFFGQLTGLVNFWIDIGRAICSGIDSVLGLDIMPLLMTWLGVPAAVPAWEIARAAGLEAFTIGDALGVGLTVTRIALDRFLQTLEVALLGFALAEALPTNTLAKYLTRETLGRLWARARLTPHHNYMLEFRRRIGGLRQILSAGSQVPADLGPESAPPSWLLTSFPRLDEAFFGPGGAALRHFSRELGARAGALRGELDDILLTGQGMMYRFGERGQRLAGEYDQIGERGVFRQLARQADALANDALGPQRAELLARAPRPDPLAALIEDWLQIGGQHGTFAVIGAAIPVFFQELQRHWHEQEARGEETTTVLLPTSPHILARHARLGRVVVPNAHVVAANAPLDDTLLDTLAGRLRAEVQGAYARGEARMTELVQLTFEHEHSADTKGGERWKRKTSATR